MADEDAGSTPAENTASDDGVSHAVGASVRAAMVAVARFRADLAQGSFYKLLLSAYGVLAVQILGFSKFDLAIAGGIVEAAPVGDLLFTVPALTLLPGVHFIVLTYLLMYLTSKGEVPADVRANAGFFVLVALVLTFLGVLVAALFLPVAILVAFVIFVAVFYGRVPVGRLIGRPPADDDPYLLALARSARAITDLWGPQETPPVPEMYEAVTATRGGRTRIGAWLVAAGLVVATVAAYPRPWMPTRTVLTAERFEASTCGVTEVDATDGSDERLRQVIGFPLGEHAGRLTMLTPSRRCLITMNLDEVDEQYVCRSRQTPIWARTVWDVVSNAHIDNRRCPR